MDFFVHCPQTTDHRPLLPGAYSGVRLLQYEDGADRVGGERSDRRLDAGHGLRRAEPVPASSVFPDGGAKDGWARLAKNLRAEIDEERIEAYRGVKSLSFEPGEHRRMAVKIVDDRGIESLKILDISEL